MPPSQVTFSQLPCCFSNLILNVTGFKFIFPDAGKCIFTSSLQALWFLFYCFLTLRLQLSSVSLSDKSCLKVSLLNHPSIMKCLMEFIGVFCFVWFCFSCDLSLVQSGQLVTQDSDFWFHHVNKIWRDLRWCGRTFLNLLSKGQPFYDFIQRLVQNWFSISTLVCLLVIKQSSL